MKEKDLKEEDHTQTLMGKGQKDTKKEKTMGRKGREKQRKTVKEEHFKSVETVLLVIGLALTFFTMLAPLTVATPTGPDAITSISNETKATTSALEFNISGGYISTFNITASVQNTKWKAFVGNVTGVFTLDDASGSTIYDWQLTSISGEVYASRNTTVGWSGIGCADIGNVTAEDTNLDHNSSQPDSINSTFTYNGNSQTFVVAGNTITASSCYATNTYVNNASQGTEFEEVILADTSSRRVFATILEPNEAGFDGHQYDFQMIVPENANETFTGATPYYIYIELS